MSSTPTVAGFLNFIRTIMGIDATVLPDNSAVIPIAFTVALNIVNPQLAQVSYDARAVGGVEISMYTWAVYNLAGSNLLNYAQDLPDAAVVPGSDPAAPFFKNMRKVWNLTGFTSGVVQSTNDESTGVSLVVMEAAKNFTLRDLQNLKDPYGREYLMLAQDYGSIWGISF